MKVAGGCREREPRRPARRPTSPPGQGSGPRALASDSRSLTCAQRAPPHRLQPFTAPRALTPLRAPWAAGRRRWRPRRRGEPGCRRRPPPGRFAPHGRPAARGPSAARAGRGGCWGRRAAAAAASPSARRRLMSPPPLPALLASPAARSRAAPADRRKPLPPAACSRAARRLRWAGNRGAAAAQPPAAITSWPGPAAGGAARPIRGCRGTGSSEAGVEVVVEVRRSEWVLLRVWEEECCPCPGGKLRCESKMRQYQKMPKGRASGLAPPTEKSFGLGS